MVVRTKLHGCEGGELVDENKGKHSPEPQARGEDLRRGVARGHGHLIRLCGLVEERDGARPGEGDGCQDAQHARHGPEKAPEDADAEEDELARLGAEVEEDVPKVWKCGVVGKSNGRAAPMCEIVREIVRYSARSHFWRLPKRRRPSWAAATMLRVCVCFVV